MKKNLTKVIEQLDLTIANMKTLKESEFDYSYLVSEFDEEKKCGTVCCVAGWYPKWYPESGFRWVVTNKNWPSMRNNHYSYDSYNCIYQALSDFHGVSQYIVKILFYGYDCTEFDFITPKFYPLPDVIERFEKMRNLLATEQIPLDYSE